MDVSAWLRDLGLTCYESLFRDNHVDASVLPDLTVDDLRDLGIASVGHRRRLLKAIEALNLGQEPPPSVGSEPPAAATSAERRQLTVMFCDLVGSTALSVQLDPEDMAAVLRAFQAAVAEATGCFGGYVAKLMGDGALVYFGYPQAHEDDAERAVRAALALVGTVQQLESGIGPALDTRVGIATGLVVVGEVMGDGAARERGVVGDTPNLAARLQALASPGTVVVAAATRHLLRSTFALRDLGRHALKGIAEPVQAWSVVGETAHASRFEATRAPERTPFVGRAQEIALLTDRWRDTVEGEGRAVLLSGEAGIGKSRIIEEFRAAIAHEPHRDLVFQCSPHRTNDAFHPIAGQIRRWARIEAGEVPEVSLSKLQVFVADRRLDQAHAVPLLAAMLSIPLGGGHAPDVPPSEAKERLVRILVALLLDLGREKPVFALVEDAHWIDPSTREVLGRIIGCLADIPALLVVTFRPEAELPWASRPHVTTHSLNTLGRRHVLAMIAGVGRGDGLAQDLVDQIVDKTDGVPLFIEELTKTVMELGALERSVSTTVPAPIHIPSTLHDSLMARLDRLGSVKEVAQVGAVIGRTFSFSLLERVSGLKPAALAATLNVLEASGLVHGHGSPPEATYTFKHALVQNAAYASLLRGQRQRQSLHARVAAAMADGIGADERDLPIIAHHYTEAGMAEPATRSWLAAAEAALTPSAYQEASGYGAAALELVARIPDESVRAPLELKCLLAQAKNLMFARGVEDPATTACLQAARRLVDGGAGDDTQRLELLHSLTIVDYIEARMGPALQGGRAFLALAEGQPDPVYRMAGEIHVGTVLLLMGKLREALPHFARAETLGEAVRQGWGHYRLVWEPRIALLCMKQWTLLALGRHREAQAAADRLAVEQTAYQRPYTVAYARYLGTVLPASMFGDLAGCERESAALAAYCEAHGVDEFAHLGRLRETCARALREPGTAHAAALPSTKEPQHWRSHVSESYNLAQNAEVLLLAGDRASAATILQRAFAFVERSQEGFWLSDLHMLDGRIELAGSEPDHEKALACFTEGMAVAERQGARVAQLRAATLKAQLLRDLGRLAESSALIAPILAKIDGGDEARDVREAMAFVESAAKDFSESQPSLTSSP